MGDPKRQRKKFNTPAHPWQKQRLQQEVELRKEYGLRNKSEVWKAMGKLKHYADLAKQNIGEGASYEEGQMLVSRLAAVGIIPEEADLNDILTISPRNLLERRLQTLVYRKGLAHSLKQARQFITHGHIMVNDKKVTVPSQMVRRDEEDTIVFAPNSPLHDESHPERYHEEGQAEASPQASNEKEEE